MGEESLLSVLRGERGAERIIVGTVFRVLTEGQALFFNKFILNF